MNRTETLRSIFFRRYGAAFLLLFMCILPTSAQLRFGLRGGMNIAKFSLKSEVFDADNRQGFFVGPTLRLDLPAGGLGADIAALYEAQQISISDHSFWRKNIIVPVNARLYITSSDVLAIYLAAGPQLAFNVGDDEVEWTKEETYRNTFKLKDSQFSFNLGGGFRINKFEVGLAYNIPVGRTGDLESIDQTIDEIYDASKLNSNAWRLSVTLYF